VREGASRAFGARPLRRAVRRLIEEPLSEALLDGWAEAGGAIELDDTGDSGSVLLHRDRDGAERRVAVDSDAGGIEAATEAAPSGDAWEDTVGEALSPAVRAVRA
jgi:hypothetical protein